MIQLRYPNITGRTLEERQAQMERYMRSMVDQVNLMMKGNESHSQTVGDQTTQADPSIAKINALEESVRKSYRNKAGLIYPYAGNKTPDGFLLCDGSSYSRTAYPELFAAIGTTYGDGDGSTTFNVPNLSERVPVGTGKDYELGATGGEATHTLTIDEMPNHTHKLLSITKQLASGTNFSRFTSDGTTEASTITKTGGSEAHNNMQPYTVVNYIIATGKT